MKPPKIVTPQGNGIDRPNVGEWDTASADEGRRDVDYERKPVLYLPDGRALVRRAGF